MDDHCSSCGQKDNCGSVYRTLGQNTGPSVGWKVVQAFLIPIAIFIAALAAAERFAPAAEGSRWRLVVWAGAAAALVLLYAAVLRFLVKKRKTGTHLCDGKETTDGDIQ